MGRDLDARVAAVRHVEWGGFGTSFPLVVDSAAVEGAGALRPASAGRVSQARGSIMNV